MIKQGLPVARPGPIRQRTIHAIPMPLYGVLKEKTNVPHCYEWSKCGHQMNNQEITTPLKQDGSGGCPSKNSLIDAIAY
jgi:hypothetical protein